MSLSPDFKEFKRLFNEGKPQLLWEDISTDTETPVSAVLKIREYSDYHLLYESVEGGRKARHSIIACDPDVVWKCVDGKALINVNFNKDRNKFSPCKESALDSLRRLLSESSMEVPNNLPPMSAGIFGYMGYDMVRHMEKLPDKNPDTIGIPEAVYMRPRIVIIFDSLQDKASIITPVWVKEESGAQTSYDDARKRIKEIRTLLAKEVVHNLSDKEISVGPFVSHVEEKEYYEVVRKARDYVYAGDICQVVPSRRWEGNFSAPAFSLYRSLRSLNPSPYLFYLNLGEFALVGSSPEILVRLQDGIVTIRPIAGTRKRGNDKKEDQALEKDLLADEKELSEHLMLLDLGRNDVGRVAKAGTVKVTEKMVVERYSHVMHIVSNVEGYLAEGRDAIGALSAGFPAGTLTGAPKIRAMEIIDELEKERRSFYGGTVGYFSSGGNMDTCIAIRTGLVKDGKLYIQAGGGIVADSKEEDEFLETENKAKALMKAAEQADKFL